MELIFKAENIKLVSAQIKKEKKKQVEMSLWCDKNRPKTLGALDYHKEQAEQLKKLVNKAFMKHFKLKFAFKG